MTSEAIQWTSYCDGGISTSNEEPTQNNHNRCGITRQLMNLLITQSLHLLQKAMKPTWRIKLQKHTLH